MSSTSSSSSSSSSSESHSSSSKSSISEEKKSIEQQEVIQEKENKETKEENEKHSSTSTSTSSEEEEVEKVEQKEEIKEEKKEEQPVHQEEEKEEKKTTTSSSSKSKSSSSKSEKDEKEEVKEEIKEEKKEEQPVHQEEKEEDKKEEKKTSTSSSKSEEEEKKEEQKEIEKEEKKEEKQEEKKMKTSSSSTSSKSEEEKEEKKEEQKEEIKETKEEKKEIQIEEHQEEQKEEQTEKKERKHRRHHKHKRSEKERKKEKVIISKKKENKSSSSSEELVIKKKTPIKVIGEASNPNKPLSPFIIPSPFEDIPEDVIDPIKDIKPIKGIHEEDKERLETFNSVYKDNMKTLLSYVNKINNYEGNVYFQQKQKQSEISFKEFSEEIQKCAQSYVSLKHKQRGVLFIAKNHWKQFAMGLGCILAGMYTVYITPKTPITDIVDIIKQAGIVQIVTDIDGKDIIRDVLSLSKLQCVLVDGVVHDELYTSYDDFIKKGQKSGEKQKKIKDTLKSIAEKTEPTDIAEIVFVQGEKGLNGVMWTHGNIIAECLGLIERFKLNKEGKYIMTSHLSFYLERIFTLYLPLFVGYQVYIPVYPIHNENLQQFYTIAKEFKPTVVLGIPRFYEKLVKKGEEIIGDEKKQQKAKKMGIEGILKEEQGESKPKGFGTTRKMVYNKIKEELGLLNVELFLCSDQMQKETIEGVMGIGITVYCGLSMVETTGFSSINYELNMNVETAGKPLMNTTFTTEEKNELVISGPTVAGGYLHKKFGSKGFNTEHSGEILTEKEDQFIKITKLNPKFIYTTNHEQVCIRRLEDLLMKISVVKHVLVIGTHQTFVTCIFTVMYDVVKEKLMEKCPSHENFLRDPHFGSYVRQRIDRLNKHLPIPIQIKKFAFIEEGTEHSKFISKHMDNNQYEASLTHFEKLISSLYKRGGKEQVKGIDMEKEKQIQKERQKEEKERLKEEKRLRRERREKEKAEKK